VVVEAADSSPAQARRAVPVALEAAVQALQPQQSLVALRHHLAKATTVVPELLRVDRTLAAAVVVLAVSVGPVGRVVAVRAAPARRTTSRGRL
jgi:hypothetical protein